MSEESDKIKVSIIVPVYNVEKYLRRCLDSLINQTLKEIEIIIVNDGSTDDSLKICNEFEKIDIYRQLEMNLDRITEYIIKELKFRF